MSSNNNQIIFANALEAGKCKGGRIMSHSPGRGTRGAPVLAKLRAAARRARPINQQIAISRFLHGSSSQA